MSNLIKGNKCLEEGVTDYQSIKVEDFNNIKKTGFYYCTGVNDDTKNSPSNLNGYLFVHRLTDNYVYQRFIVITTGIMYFRISTAGTWGNWSEIHTDSSKLAGVSVYGETGQASTLTNAHPESPKTILFTNSTGLRLLLNPTTYAPIEASAFNQQSSRRYKENIVDMTEEEANKLDEINVVKFDYKNESSGIGVAGVIAEDVYEILPNVVTTTKIDEEEVPDSVDYSKFVPYLIKKVQMLEKRISELESKK